jgi:signal peptidase I
MTPVEESGNPGPGPVGGNGSRPEARASGSSPSEVALRRRRGWSSAFFDLLRSLALVLVFFFLVRAFLVEAFKIPTASMEGTLLVGDFLLVNKAVYGAEIPGTGLVLPSLSSPERGEVIVFHPPHEPDKHYVKRLVGLPKDTLMMSDKVLFVNGEALHEPYVRHSDVTGDAVHPAMAWQARFLKAGPRPGRYRPSRDNWGPIVVPEDRYFVLGDNRDNSEDSRYWGFVRREAIKGRPWLVYYSAAPEALAGVSWFRYVRWDRIGGRIR